MRLQTKFILATGFSVGLMLFLLLIYTAHLKDYSFLIKKIQNSEYIAQVYSEKNNYRLLIQERIWAGISAYEDKERSINDVKKELSELIKDNKINSRDVNSVFPQEIQQTIINLDDKISIYIEKVQLLIESLGRDNFSEELMNLNKASDDVNMESNFLKKQIAEFMVISNKEKEFWLKKVAVRPMLFACVLVIIILLVSGFLHSSLLKPLARLIEVMDMIANDKRIEEVPFIKRQDEIGNIAKALEVFRLTGLKKEELEEQAKQQARKAEEDRRNSMLSFSRQFETSVKGIVDTVALSVKKMDSTALELEQLSAHTQEEAKLLSETSAKASTNMQGVSKATSEFTTEVNEITIQVNNSLGYASKVVEQAEQVNSMVADLETKANAVSSIIDIINGITSQIDLLALNATIEAARAGDMGKGFAVVANEVKALATQTSKATEQINFQISGIQSSTNKAVVSIQEITESVKTINQNSASIVSSVEKQNKASSYISESISEVSVISNSVTSGVEKVADSSSHAGQASSQMASSAKDLLKQSEMLQNEVDKFLSSLKFT